jgi:hypothetical protein
MPLLKRLAPLHLLFDGLVKKLVGFVIRVLFFLKGI